MTISVISYGCTTAGAIYSSPVTNPSLSIDAGSGSDRAILCMVTADRGISSGSIASCTYNGVSLTVGSEGNTGPQGYNIRVFYLIGASVASGTNSLNAQINAGCAMCLSAIVLSGVDSIRGSTIEVAATTASSISDTITSAAGDTLVIFGKGAAMGVSTVWSATSPAVMQNDQGTIFGSGSSRACIAIQAGEDGTNNVQLTHNYGGSREIGMHTLSLIPAGGASKGRNTQRLLLGVG